ncbi:hypothetical protein KAZ01_02775 [Candidatus Gracilibacteria bacterium]|nr:hypothetical protein [Candidatus Gracilibacteria bacterium]
MKYFNLILVIFININISYSDNCYLFNNIKKIDGIDTCKIIKLSYLKEEMSLIVNEYYKYAKENDCTFNEKHILYIELKKLNDSTNIYIMWEDFFLSHLLFNIPSYYYLTDSTIICIYTGKENPKKLNHTCIKPFYEDAKKYSVDSLRVLSWKHLKFEIYYMLLLLKDPFPCKIEVKKSKILNINSHFYLNNERLYKDNMLNKVKLFMYDGTPFLY